MKEKNMKEKTEFGVKVPVVLHVTMDLEDAETMGMEELSHFLTRVLDEVVDSCNSKDQRVSISTFWDKLPEDDIEFTYCDTGLFGQY